MKQVLVALGLMIAAFVVGLAVGRYATPAKIVKETVTVEKEVVKKDVQTQIVYKEIKRPDGTTEITKVETQIDKSVLTTELKKSELVIVEKEKHQWSVRGIVEARELDLKPMWGIGVERRILGPVFVGAYYTMTKTVGLTASLEF